LQCASIIKDIGRGKDGARSLTREQAQTLWTAILAGEVSDLELGAILLALRVKGESVDELAGFLDATHAAQPYLPAPAAASPPVVIPSYNGARHLPNLVPMLALLLAERGVPVLVHGIVSDPMADQRARGARVTTAEVLLALGLDFVKQARDLPAALHAGVERRLPVFVPVQVLHPRLAQVLGLRRTLGVRNSAHTLVKLLQPFQERALRLCSYTHPEYEHLLHQYLAQAEADALIGRGTEGEVVANVRRAQTLTSIVQGETRIEVESQEIAPASAGVLPSSREAALTAVWTQSVLAGEHPIPQAIQDQVDAVMRTLARMGVDAQALAA
jgi:anthranilate phosphoribosyltransferase